VPPPQTSATGAFNRALGASGFALVNVANVPISLGRWMVGNDPANRWVALAGWVAEWAELLAIQHCLLPAP
jgi:hypothetical protein